MRSSVRTWVVWSVTTLAATASVAVLLPAVPPAGSTFPDLLVAGCAVAGVLATGWLWLLVTLVVFDALRGRPGRSPVPEVVRRAVLAACGLTLAGGLAVPAHASGADGAGGAGGAAGASATERAGSALAGLPLPDRATSTSAWLSSVATPGPRADPPAPTPVLRDVTVAPGDSLWSIARDTLPADASALDVDRRWREIYAANREAIGADPDLIRPGQRLSLPGPVRRA